MSDIKSSDLVTSLAPFLFTKTSVSLMMRQDVRGYALLRLHEVWRINALCDRLLATTEGIG